MTIQSRKQEFLRSVSVQTREHAINNCLIASVRRNQTYAISFDGREPFRKAFTSELLTQSERYQIGVGENEHLNIIENIAKKLTETHGNILHGGCLRIGTVQKGLNLYLKMLWCLEADWPTPPHCPIDRIVLQAARIYENWTQLNSIAMYQEWVSKLHTHAARLGFSSLAEWELYTWNP